MFSFRSYQLARQQGHSLLTKESQKFKTSHLEDQDVLNPE
jgi:hypothetical protein